MSTNERTEAEIAAITKYWNGGERKFAGSRANALVFGNGNIADQKTLARLVAAMPGIQEHVVIPPNPAPVAKARSSKKEQR
jgi:hypothetical protein